MSCFDQSNFYEWAEVASSLWIDRFIVQRGNVASRAMQAWQSKAPWFWIKIF
jgi:hypothetical protein